MFMNPFARPPEVPQENAHRPGKRHFWMSSLILFPDKEYEILFHDFILADKIGCGQTGLGNGIETTFYFGKIPIATRL